MSETKKFDFDAVLARRAAFIERVRPGWKMVPYDEQWGPWQTCPLDISQEAYRSLEAIAWMAVADLLRRAAGEHGHIIDHAWTFGMVCCEPDDMRGFVTEPYIGGEDLDALMSHRFVNWMREHWQLDITAYPSPMSPWYPGNTVPIVVGMKSDDGVSGNCTGSARMFLPQALAYAFPYELKCAIPGVLRVPRAPRED